VRHRVRRVVEAREHLDVCANVTTATRSCEPIRSSSSIAAAFAPSNVSPASCGRTSSAITQVTPRRALPRCCAETSLGSIASPSSRMSRCARAQVVDRIAVRGQRAQIELDHALARDARLGIVGVQPLDLLEREAAADVLRGRRDRPARRATRAPVGSGAVARLKSFGI
jgi:hypothetical protein